MARSASIRSTRQRQAIREAIERSPTPLTPPEILRAATTHAEGLGLATVYRAIKQLIAEGLVRAVEFPGHAPRYESASRGHHHHWVCTRCERVFELDACCGHFEELTPKGFQLEAHELTLYGRCAECARKQLEPDAPR